MRAIAVAAVILLVLIAGIVDWIQENDAPAPLKRNVRLWEEAWNEGNYSVPKCAQTWPSECPGSNKIVVRECARHWPTTCPTNKDPDRTVDSREGKP
jgi:hypothetical protein